jgi:hypothetical protein
MKINWHLNTEGNVAVADNIFWQSMDVCPYDVKCLLLTDGGTAVVGTYTNQKWFVGWCPLPKTWRKSNELVEHETRMRVFESMRDA